MNWIWKCSVLSLANCEMVEQEGYGELGTQAMMKFYEAQEASECEE